VPLDGLAGDVNVPAARLVEKVKAFGAPFVAAPGEDGEYSCTSGAPPATLPPGAIVGPGVLGAGGARLEADVEGLAIFRDRHDAYLIVSSQGANAYQVYDLEGHGPLAQRFLGSFQVEGVAHTDGVAVTGADLGDAYSHGLLVVQNGDAPAPASTAPIHGFKYKSSAQLMYVRWEDVAAGFDPPLAIGHSR